MTVSVWCFNTKLKRKEKKNGQKQSQITNTKYYINAYRLIPVPYGSTCCTYHHLQFSSPNCSNKNKKARATQKSLPFGKWRIKENEVRILNGPKAEKDKTERVTRLGRRTREEI